MKEPPFLGAVECGWQGGRVVGSAGAKGGVSRVGVGAEMRSGAREEPQRRRDVAFDGGR
jgi:hypothetical protein